MEQEGTRAQEPTVPAPSASEAAPPGSEPVNATPPVPPPTSSTPIESPRSRIRRALVCPYCKDEVGRRGALLCARRKCGALYHRECWEDCVAHYGGCAVFGCESRRSREVSAVGYLFRLMRFLVAAVLFPPRVASGIRKYEGESFVAILRAVFGDVRRGGKIGRLVRMLVLACCLPVAFFAFRSVVGIPGAFPEGVWIHETFGAGPPTAFMFFGLVTLAATFVALLIAAGLAVTIMIYAAKVLAFALRTELSALVRADEGATVLGRIRSFKGK